MASEYEKKGFNYRGVKFRTWLYFTLFSCALLTFMCALQLIMFRAYYQRMKVTEMESLAERLDRIRDNHDLLMEIRASGFVSGSIIYVFETDGDQIVSYVDSTDFGRGETPPGLEEADFSEELKDMLFASVARLEGNDRVYFVDTIEENQTMRLNYLKVRAVQAPGTRRYILLQSPYAMGDFTSLILSRQLIFAILMCLLLSLMLSYILARHLAQPLTKLTASAHRLAKGDYDVEFDASGYAEIDDLAATLNKATEEIRASDALRKDLIANISHELRTPLTMIKAYAEMIRDLSGDNPKKREEHVQVILDETDRLSALVTDILDLSKIQSQTDAPDKTIFDLAALVREVEQRFDGMFSPQGYRLDTDIMAEGYVIANAKQVGQIVYNLTANALNYVGDDKRIFVSLKEEERHIVFRVQDHGKGIAPEDLAHIWDRYFRSAESKRTKIGSGIGLSIVKGICEANGLRYGVDSVLGEGSTFYVVFPKVEPTVT